MPDNFPRLNPGDSFRPTAAWYNRTIDVITRQDEGERGTALGGMPFYVRNDSDYDLPIHAVVGVRQSIIEIEGDSENHLFNIVFSGVVYNTDVPAFYLPIAVLAEPCAIGAIAKATLYGTTWVRLMENDSSHEYAWPISSNWQGMRTVASPFVNSPLDMPLTIAKILWRDEEATADGLWAYVILMPYLPFGQFAVANVADAIRYPQITDLSQPQVYDSGTTYFRGEVVASSSADAGLIYISRSDGNVGNALANPTYWQPMLRPDYSTQLTVLEVKNYVYWLFPQATEAISGYVTGTEENGGTEFQDFDGPKRHASSLLYSNRLKSFDDLGNSAALVTLNTTNAADGKITGDANLVAWGGSETNSTTDITSAAAAFVTAYVEYDDPSNTYTTGASMTAQWCTIGGGDIALSRVDIGTVGVNTDLFFYPAGSGVTKVNGTTCVSATRMGLTFVHGWFTGGTASVSTADIQNNAVTYALMQALSTTSRLLGSSATTTPVQEITIGSGLTMSGTTLSRSGTIGLSDGGTNANFSGTGPGIVTQASAGANLTVAQQADIGALTDNSGGTANTTIEAMPDPADTPADADALRDDLVANLIPALRNNIADLTAQVNAVRATLRAAGLMA